MLREAGELRIPFTSGILVGIGESPEERVAALEALAEVHAEHGHLQEVILQNFVAHRATTARSRPRSPTARNAARRKRRPSCRCRVGVADLARRHARAGARLPGAYARRGGADPPEPVRLVAAARGRGRHRPRRPVRQRRPHLAGAPVPVRAPDAQAARTARLRADRAAVRVPAVHGPRVARAGRARRDQAEVLELHPPPRVGAPGGAGNPARPGAGGYRERARRRRALGRGAHRPVRGDAAGGDRGHAPGGRRAARRGRGRPSRSSSTGTSTSRTSASSAARSAASARASARPTPTTTRGTSSCAGWGRRWSSVPPRSACSRASIPTGRWRTTRAGCAWRRRSLPTCTCTPTRRWRSTSWPASGRSTRSSSACARPGWVHARDRGRGAARWRAPADLAEQAAGGALGGDHGGVRRGRPVHKRDRDVRPHRGAVGAGRAHARGALAPGTDRRVQRVRAALLHPLPHAARADARHRGDLARGEPEAHRGLPPGARQDRAERPGELGEDGAGRGHRGARLGE